MKHGSLSLAMLAMNAVMVYGANFSDSLIIISDPTGHMQLEVQTSNSCRISSLTLDGREVLSSDGIYSGVRTMGGTFTSVNSHRAPRVMRTGNVVKIDSICYGDKALGYTESWTFTPVENSIVWNIESHTATKLSRIEDRFLPQWNFAGMNTWKGGILDNGGMVWCKYLRGEGDTYGVHTGGVTFWNPDYRGALRISTSTDGVMHQKFTQGADSVFVVRYVPSDDNLDMRYNLSRFVYGREDVFVSQKIHGGRDVSIVLSYVDYPGQYSRGNLPGVDADAVRELLNTTGRYGVVDNGIVGANGWTTNWKCLHEPFFAQIGLALADTNYTRNLAESLHQEALHAVMPDGRVLSRWHNADEDQMPGTYNYQTGYYEARWGYTVDSQTGYVINVAELFGQLGSEKWLAGQKQTCEKALDWLLERDENGNGLVEMMNRSHREGTASDWLDIVWASYENAFVNAQMYEALRLWAECEAVLGDTDRSVKYNTAAAKLKDSFNRPVEEGGFWSDRKGQYVYWLDDDGSAHGDNMVTPVNFAAIAFGICDDPQRKARILDEIERRTVAENLFHWPLCFDSYKREEVEAGNWPFPRYENGDIFPTWGYLGVRAYADYKPQLAMKYVHNILAQYRKDGLSSQRYLRESQLGEGADILAGICTSITALYSDIYGLRPCWNRLGLEPHIVPELYGTEFNYSLRGIDYTILLERDGNTLSTGNFKVRSKHPFGVDYADGTLRVFPGNSDKGAVLEIKSTDESAPVVMILDKLAKQGSLKWKTTTSGVYSISVSGLQPLQVYSIATPNGSQRIKADENGRIELPEATYRKGSFSI